MTFKPAILALAGSLRTDSYNKRLVKVAARGAEAAGATTTFLDLRELDLPLYDEDVEKRGFPAGVTKLKAIMKQHQGLLIASPEYNSSISAALKNAIDWASRPAPNEKPLECFADKVAGLVSASPGALGGLRGLVHLRAILGNIQVLVVHQQVAVPKANEAFTPEGDLKDEKQRSMVEGVGAVVARLLTKIHRE